MTGRVLPRYVILVSTLTLVVIGIMLSIFYGQYRWLASGIVSSSVEQHELSLNASFERQARGASHRIADSLSVAEADGIGAKILVLSEAIAHSTDLVGLRYVQSDGVNVQSGEPVEDPGTNGPVWRADYMYMSYPVQRDDVFTVAIHCHPCLRKYRHSNSDWYNRARSVDRIACCGSAGPRWSCSGYAVRSYG